MSRLSATENTKPWVLGLGASHNGSACLLRGDEIVVAIQEERLSRVKRQRTQGSEPNLAVQYCLETAGIQVADLAMVVHCAQGEASSVEQDLGCNRQLRLATHGIPWLVIPHHLGHAISAFATSSFEEASVLVIDGLGSPFKDLSPEEQRLAGDAPDAWEMISLYHASGTTLTPLEKHMTQDGDWLQKHTEGMPRFRSLGGMYSAVATQIFGDPMDAGKVMGLAPLGEATFAPEEFFEIGEQHIQFNDSLTQKFRHNRRWPDCQEDYQDLARSVQEALEVAVLALVRRLTNLSPSRSLCYAGGVALNCVTNERLFRETPFEEIYIPPAAEDSGTAIGAAYFGLWHLLGENSRRPLQIDAMGRSYSQQELESAVATVPGARVAVRGLPEVLDETVRRLQVGQLGGWFQGRSELGPRALGNRSIVADPRSIESKEQLNGRIKFRESFRPFAPVILTEEVDDWFELDGASKHSPFMLRTWPFRQTKKDQVPAVAHVDGSGRVQTVDGSSDNLYASLVSTFFAATGVPILLNTSFNGRGEPIVESPEDALWCMLQNGLDFAVLGDLLIDRSPKLSSLLDLHPTLVAKSYSLEIPLSDGRFSNAPPPGTSLLFRVSTRWGEREQRLPDRYHSLLTQIDDTTDGWSLLRHLKGTTGRDIAPEWLIETLGALRRYAIIDLCLPPVSEG